MRLEAHAKVNLGLDVKYKREDGYHELDMIFLEVPLHDIVEIEIKDEPGIALTCSDASLENEKNLAYRAAALMFDTFGSERGVSIHIEKNIPMQAGLGGGSSDAAAVLRGMNELFCFGASSDTLRELGIRLGADVPFFIEGGCARAGGIGEKLRQLYGIPHLNIRILKPGVSISTAYAYGNLKLDENAFHPDIDALEKALVSGDIKKAASLMGNSLEAAVTDRYPVITELKEELMEQGAYGSIMTGSGSAVFGIFRPVKILFYGDSNTYGYDPRSFSGGRYDIERIWTSLAASAFGDSRTVINEGMNGRCLPEGENGLRYIGSLLEDLDKYDYFVIMLGTNDLLSSYKPDADLPIRRMKGLLEWLTARKSCPRVFVIAPPLIGSGKYPDPELRIYHDANVLMNEGFRGLAKEYGAGFADASAWNIELAYDGVHFSEEGHKRFAEMIVSVFDERKDENGKKGK